MGNQQSQTARTIGDQEVVPQDIRTGALKENTDSPCQKSGLGPPVTINAVTNHDKESLQVGKSAILTIANDGTTMLQDSDFDKRKTKHADKVMIAKVDAIRKSKPKQKSAASTRRGNISSRKKKWCTWFPWKRRKEHKPVVTTGLTMKLDSKHSMLIYFPDDREDIKDNDKKASEEKSSKSSLLDQCCTIFGDDKKPTRTKLLIKDVDDVRGVVSMKIKGRKDCCVDPTIVCGLQLHAMRHHGPDNNKSLQESAPQSRMPRQDACGFIPHRDMKGMNVLAPTMIESQKFQELMSICNEKLGAHFEKETNIPLAITEDGKARPAHSVRDEDNNKVYDLSGCSSQFSRVYSAIVPRGIGKHIFTHDRVLHNLVEPVDDLVCIDQKSHVYVCDIGLTPTQCDFITDTTERCSRGNYAAYTYAKQTLGCRDHDELAVICEWPVMRAYSSIINHLDKRLKNEDGSSMNRQLVLDDREPHLVKYDTSKKERQKLDMHTDKSEWTFLIALSDGDGVDYEGGGTYIECIDTIVHLQKGHALIFPGKRRHRGQKIVNGLRFLLVGFLVEKLDQKKECGEVENDDFLNSNIF